MMTKGNKKVLGGSWLLLTLLMIGMSWSQAIPPASEPVSVDSIAETGADADVDYFGLNVEEYATADYAAFGYDDEDELVGSRTATSKTYVTEEGKVALVATDPIHYLDDQGVWQDVDLNVESEANGWSVTENVFDTHFDADMNRGVLVQVDDNIDPIRFGVNPVVVYMDNDMEQPMFYEVDETEEVTQAAGNVLRYPIGQGIALDYQVTSTKVKQNLVVRDQPFFGMEFNGWFGLQEEMPLPYGYAVFDGSSPLTDGQFMKTNESVEIRNIETGELLVSIPAPQIIESDPDAIPHIGMYYIMQIGEQVMITTAVDSEWLMDENRSFPIMIDPTIDVGASTTYYTYKYTYRSWRGNYYYTRSYSTTGTASTCSGASSYYTQCTGSSYYPNYVRNAVHRFNLQNTMPSGATITAVDYENHVGRYRTGSRSYEVAVLKSGSSQSSTMVDPASYMGSYGANRHTYSANSPDSSAATTLSDPGYYRYGGSIRSISMNSNGIADVQDAVDGNAAGSSGHILGLAVRASGNSPYWYWCSQSTYTFYGCSNAANKPHLEITYTGGSDTAAPTADFKAFDGKTTYLEGSRTMYIGLVDASGVNTTAAGMPHLYYRVDGGSWTGVSASTVGTCVSGQTCNFKATIPAQTAPATGTKTVDYYWAYRDSPSPPNGGISGTTGTTPAGGTGIPSNMQAAPSSPYSYDIEHVDNAADGDNKWEMKASGQNSYSYSSSANRYYDWQMTYFEPSREYLMEYDTSNCGTGFQSCFNTGAQLDLRYLPTTSRICTTTNCQTNMEKTTVPGLTMNSRTGPGSDLIWYFDGAEWGVMGYDVASGTGIDKPQTGGQVINQRSYGSTDDGYYKVPIPGDITGYFGTFSWNATYGLNSANRNLFCVNTNANPIMFVRTTYTGATYSNPCLSTYYYYRYNYAWNGWSNPGWDGKVSSSFQINSKVSSIKPAPDTFPPEFGHSGFLDTYVEDSRTLSMIIKDAGDPPMGLNTSSATDSNGVLEGPHMKYRMYDAEAGTWSGWSTRSMTPDAARSSCENAQCTWSTSIPGTDRGNSVEYTLHAKDLNGNWNNTTAMTYDIVTPTKVFVIEWHDMNAGSGRGYEVSYQVRLYDVSNEIEFAYDTNSNAYTDYQTIAFQNPAATIGEVLRGRGPGYLSGGQNPFANNFRIATDGTEYSTEAYGAGMTELFNYDEVFTGSNNGNPYTYYCTRYFTSYRGDCSVVIDLPTDFEFDYFGSTFNGTQGHKIHAIRHGAMQFSTSSTTNSAQMMSSGWGTTMPSLPNSGTYANNVDLAPWWGYYAAYRCYYNSASECSIRTKMIPFDGAGMDVTADITTPTIWDTEMSPIRVNPSSGDYLQVSADLTIDAGVEVQIAEGKGIVFTGACNKLTASGNETHPVNITNMGTNYAKGIAFTNGGCTTASTTDRHTFTHTNFENMEIAISAGSRHGNAPHYNGNVGDFSFSDVTFTNVNTAIKHGSGQGTGFDLSSVSMENSADSCVELPDDSTLTWVGGSATDCNTHAYTGQGAIDTGDGSTVVLENVSLTDAAVNGIVGNADSLWMSNVTIDASSGFSSQQTGTGVAQTSTATSGTDFYAFNVEISNYNAAVTTHATDSIHMEQVDSSGDSNGFTITPAGASSPAIGDTGWTMDGLSADGGLTMARTQPSTMDNVDLGGALTLSGTAPSTDRVVGTTVSAEGITVNGCGWNIDLSTVTIGDGSSDAWISANCASSASSSVVTVHDGTMSGDSTNNNFMYARNAILTVAEMTVTGQTNWGNNLASAGTNGDIRLIDVNFRGNDCLDSTNSADTSVCWVEAASSTSKIYFGGLATVSVYRSGSSGNAMQANHNVATAVHDASGAEMFTVGSSKTDASGAADAWIITDLYERDNTGSTSSSATYTDHTIRAAGGAGQNVTTPSDPWYTAAHNPDFSSDLPLEVGEHVYLKLEAFPMDFGGGTKDCSFFANNDSASTVGGYYTYTRQIITLSSDMTLDGCSVHLQGTSLRINRTQASNPVITLRNGAELLISEHDGDFGNIKAQSTAYPWTMSLTDGGKLVIDAGSIRDMNGGLTVDGSGSLEMRNGSTAYGSPNAAPTTATVNVNGGTLTINNANVQNVNSGVGINLEDTASSSLSNVVVKNAETGITVVNAAPTIDGFTLTDNTVGIDMYGGMSLPTIYRSPLLSGESTGWKTHAIDITSFATENNFVQVGTNFVYAGGNADPRGSYYGRYFMVTDRYRIAVDDGSGLTNVTDSSVTGYYPWGNNDPSVTGNAAQGIAATHTYSGGVGGAPVWDCNLYGYKFNPGASYAPSSYYYFIAYGGGKYSYGPGDEPNEFGFRLESAPGITESTYAYPYHFWGGYWPSFYYGANRYNGDMVPPEGFNGMWGSYNVCKSYAYRSVTNAGAGWRMAYPIVDTSSNNIQQVVMYMDVLHNGNDYYQDRLEVNIRGANNVGSLLSADYGREFGTAQVTDGTISGADTGIEISGARAGGDMTDIVISNPVNEGVLISGNSDIKMDSITVNGGKYGMRMGSSADGAITMTNVVLDNQSRDGVALDDMSVIMSGTISNASYCGLKILSSSGQDWNFDGLALNDNEVGVTHQGTGLLALSDVTMTNNVMDAELDGSARVEFLEGVVDQSLVNVEDSAQFIRMRSLDTTITADGAAVDGAPVRILDADMRVADSSSTDSTGAAAGLSFTTWTADSSGITTANLNGYQLVTIASVAYSSGSEIDIRYAMNTLSLSDAPGNSGSAALVDTITDRTCYGYSTTSYSLLAGSCTGLNIRSSRVVDGVNEHGYYNMPSNMNNKVIMMDTPFNYVDLGSGSITFTNSVIFTTGCYQDETRLYATYPYRSHIRMDNTTMISMCVSPQDNPTGFRLGYSGTSNYGNFHVNNSKLLGLKTIATGSGYYNNNGDLEVTNSLLMHHQKTTPGGTVFFDDMCIRTAGYDDMIITGNTFVDCKVGVDIASNTYAYSTWYSGNGTNNMKVNNNNFVDTTGFGMWFYLNAHSHNAEFNDNTFSGTIPTYGVYAQDSTVTSVEISGNTIRAENPVYLRGAQQWTISNNDITGIKSASRACIYTLNGHGSISGNDCMDADGGISISGIRTGNDVHIDNNTIAFSPDRLPTSAVGIYVDSCGLDEVFMADNTVNTMMNALNVDGCTVTDNRSVYTGIGGSAGRTHNVNMDQSTYTPAHLTGVCVGDSVRWTSRAYYSTNTPHSTTSDAGQTESWDSTPMNLGSTFVHQFTTAGNFTYYSVAAQTTVTGSVEVSACSGGNNLVTTGLDILGGGDDITLNGVTVSGFNTGVAMTGGDLSLAAGTAVVGVTAAVEATNVDIVVNGANLIANSTYGIGLDAESQGGNDVLDLTGLSTSGAIGVHADGHKLMRWNGGVADSATVLKTSNGASGTLENMSSTARVEVDLTGDNVWDVEVVMPLPWEVSTSCYETNMTRVAGAIMAGVANPCGGPANVIDAGAYSTVTSIGNGLLNNGLLIAMATGNAALAHASKLTVDADAIVHEGNLLDLTVTHMGQTPASDVGLFIHSVAQAQNLVTGEMVGVPGGRAEYVSPSWRSSPGRTITIDGQLMDWLGMNPFNDADDMMPGAVAVNATTLAHMRITWDTNYMFVALVGPTFISTDGLFYLDTAPGGSSTGEMWHSQHTLPIEADYMLWMEDLNNWGLKKVMPTGNWVDVTSSCPQITSHIFVGNPYVTTPVSEFRVPWSCLGNPAENVRWIAMVQWDAPFGQPGQVAGVFPEQPFNRTTTTGQTFANFGNFNLLGTDLSDGTLDDHLLLFRSYVGTSVVASDPHIYQIKVKVRNAEGDYWDWGEYTPLIMTTNQDVSIDILRAKPVIENLVDVEYDEDSGTHTISLTNKASDYQDDNVNLTWAVADAASNTHSYPDPYNYDLTGQTLTITTKDDQFGGHRLQMTVTDSHGLSATQTMNVGIWNVNDAPVIWNNNRFDGMPVFYDDGAGNLNVKDENFNGLITKELGSTSNASRSYIVDMENEQTQSDWNNWSVPQTYTWVQDEGNCVPFDSNVDANVLTIAENVSNEAGGNCDIVLDLSDDAGENSDAQTVTVNFIVNPVNDAPVIKDWDTTNGVHIEMGNGSTPMTSWNWDVMEDDESVENLTIDLTSLMADNDHPLDQLTWEIEESAACVYENYFTATVDNDADTVTLDLIPDATTNAPTREIDFLQDADNDGVPDGGIHQMQPSGGTYCTVFLWLNDTAAAPSHIDYAQSASGVYEQRSVRQVLNIKVINTPEATADYNFGDENSDLVPDFSWLNIDAVLPGTRVPVDIDITNTGDAHAEYNYGHDLQIRFMTDDQPSLIQDQVTLSWDAGEVPDTGETRTIRGYVTLNNPTEYVSAFIEVRTINPHTDEYITDDWRKPDLEDTDWDDNNVTTDDTGDGIPQMVRLRPATSVASFAPGLMAVSLVGAFVGALLMRSRQDEDEAELNESLANDDEAVSPVIATILLVAITVVLSGVIYVWANSLATDSTGKATPRLTFDSEAKFDGGDNTLWYWQVVVISHDNELAAQAVYVIVEWTNATGGEESYRTSLANPDNVYGFVPSNSPSLVTYKDSIDCDVDCSAGFGSGDIVRVRMVDPGTGEPIENAKVTLQYAPTGATTSILMQWAAQYNPPSMKATF